VQDGDQIVINIPHRSIVVAVSNEELSWRRASMEACGEGAWKPGNRTRQVSTALRAYAALTTSAARGAIRELPSTRRAAPGS